MHKAGIAVGCVAVLAVAAFCAAKAGPSPQSSSATSGELFSLHRALSFPTTSNLIASPKADRIAWAFDEQGVRNIWGAQGPQWSAHRITQFSADDGQELGELAFSQDGSRIVFVRNEGEGNWASPTGTDPNPLSLPVAQKAMIWTAAFSGGTGSDSSSEAHELVDGSSPSLSPDGRRVAFLRAGQAFVIATDGKPSEAKPLFFARGKTDSLKWSPDGSMIAFVSHRGPLSLLGIFRSDTEPLQWITPSANHVTSPRWSADGKHIAFIKMPGSGGPVQSYLERHPVPFELWVADLATGQGHLVYRSPRSIPANYPDEVGELNLTWGAGERLIFTAHLADGWLHLYSVPAVGGEPTLLTPGSFMVEGVSVSPDQRTIVFNANTGKDSADDDRRHLFRVAVDRPGLMELTLGKGIEWSPVITGDGQTVAYIAATTKRSPLPAIIALSGGHERLIGADRVPKDFPGAQFLEPQKVVFKAADGVEIHAQLFDNHRTGTGLRPAAIYVHGGAARQMLLGFHYIPYYARHYSEMQYLASRGVVVLSVNYRRGIGYGDAFENPPAGGTQGASEYRDILAAHAFLAAIPGVDAKRVGIWGGSYGGYLTALALARHSDLFAAGVDVNGVDNWLTLNEEEGSFPAGMWREYQRPPDYARALDSIWRSSPVADFAHWQSPVLFIHGDDDRNVDIAQTVDMIEYLRSRGVRFEQLIIPDETHGWNLFRTWLKVTGASTEFLMRELRPMPRGSHGD